ncbi:hypothetical protein JZ751_004809 [Albula glossodonta]|uniref:Golgi resident protein GCP60 n=1 Tax=Albula glossodonta TaxID=121402 RepID=A0A8T2PC79_9TELE|nr:hypothetical protein JZ751_004809 [Albula glossodonta]
MAMEVQSSDPNSGSSSRLEVSIDGLTLSPDSEGDQEQVEGVEPQQVQQDCEVQSSAEGKDVEEGETPKTMERKWGFSLGELYGLALKFFKEKDGKAFHPTYEEKLRLVALHKQVLLGPYNPDASPEVGFFDVLGNDRRKEWAALGNIGKEEAMVEFVKLLNKCCTLFAPYVTSHKIERDEQERKRREEEERQRQEEEQRERERQEEERRRREEEEQRQREEEERRQLQEERLRMEQQNTGSAVPQAALQKQQEDVTVSASPEETSVSTPPPAETQPELPTMNGQSDEHSEGPDPEPEAELAEEEATPDLKDPSPAGTHDLASDPEPEVAPVIAAPSMWTRPQIKDFKEKIRQDADSVITVGRGEVVTVRVPTHEEGSYLFWEFATDHYDIGFGVYFEWTDSPNTSVSVHVSESSDDEDEEEGEGQNEDEKAKKNSNKPQVDEIVPVYRRDCHEEVYAGSHQYPGRGVYLLKFDNSYSLWRSKSVYYRVYYTR